jgi:hypothetical protein
VINLLANVKQKTIEPLIKDTIDPGTFVYTDEYRPTVSLLIIPLLYCHINGFQRAHPVWRSHCQEAKRGETGGQRIPWHSEAIGSFLLPGEPLGCP